MPSDLAFRAATTIGITCSAFIGVTNWALASVSIPSFLNTAPASMSPTGILLKQWHQHYDISKAKALPIIALSCISYGYAIYRARRNFRIRSTSWKLLIAAVVGMVMVPVFTKIFMEGNAKMVNDQLFILDSKINGRNPVTSSAKETANVRELLEKWALMCTIRALFPLASMVLAIWSI